MKRFFACLLLCLVLVVPVFASAPEVLPPPAEFKTVQITGTWNVTAIVDGKTTTAVCTIKKTNEDFYLLRCLGEDGIVITGLGAFENGKFWVAWGGKNTLFLCSYRVEGNGRMIGVRGTDETLTLLKGD